MRILRFYISGCGKRQITNLGKKNNTSTKVNNGSRISQQELEFGLVPLQLIFNAFPVSTKYAESENQKQIEWTNQRKICVKKTNNNELRTTNCQQKIPHGNVVCMAKVMSHVMHYRLIKW